jgi:hypothetical protein
MDAVPLAAIGHQQHSRLAEHAYMDSKTVEVLCSKMQDRQLSMANQRPLLPVFPGMSKPQHLVSKVKERRANKSQNLGGTCPDFTGKALDFWSLFFVVVLICQCLFLLGFGPAKHCASRSATDTSIHVHATLSLQQLQLWIYPPTPESFARN